MTTSPFPLKSGGVGIPADPALIEQGWERRHLADATRAAEAVEVYENAGFEVRQEQLTAQSMGAGCAHCTSGVCGSYVLIYTHRPAGSRES